MARDFPPPSTKVALVKLKNSVYRRKLWIEMFDEIGQGAIEVRWIFIVCYIAES